MTFRVEAVNQRGELVAEYDYTCIFEYAQGQREVPQDRGTAQPVPLEANVPSADGITPISRCCSPPSTPSAWGTSWPPWTYRRARRLSSARMSSGWPGTYHASNIHTDEEFARRNIFGGAVNSGPATMSYVDQMLARSFPVAGFLQWREAVDAGHYALSGRGIQYPSRARGDQQAAGEAAREWWGAGCRAPQPAGRFGLPGRRRHGHGPTSRAGEAAMRICQASHLIITKGRPT